MKRLFQIPFVFAAISYALIVVAILAMVELMDKIIRIGTES